MFRVLRTAALAPGIRRLSVVAPRVARRWRPGQFVIVRPTPSAERIPLTIVDGSESAIDLVVHEVGRTTLLLNRLEAGDEITDLVGPLGNPTETDHFGTVVVVGGGVGTAVAYPVGRALVDAGNRVIAVIGARSSDMLVLVDEFAALGAEVAVTTDDGSAGTAGPVTIELRRLVDAEQPARVFAAGPIPMMRAVAEATRDAAIPTWVSLNPIMIDGTGMCGGCRVRIGDQTRFACVDGPEFDGHLVDFDLLERRNHAYAAFERCALARTVQTS
jgi:ferredoxin/flavodoxin---NADP+ reductase